MIGGMAPPSDQTARHLQKLAALVTQRRAQLRLSQEKAAKACGGLAYMTYRKVEEGLPVRPSTYAKVEIGFGMRAGSCKAVIDGADSITLEDGTELIEGGQIVRVDTDALNEEIPNAVTRSAMLVAPELTGHQIKAINERVMEELRRRGILPSEL